MPYFANQKILVPFDFSELSRKAVMTAIEISGSGNNVVVLHVIEPMIAYDVDAQYNEEIDEAHAARAMEAMSAAFQDSSNEGLTFETTFGDPSHTIADFAADRNFQLIVMPSHGRTGFKRLFLGSVAERVVRLAHCPVLVLRI